jgi:hypothetical protein
VPSSACFRREIKKLTGIGFPPSKEGDEEQITVIYAKGLVYIFKQKRRRKYCRDIDVKRTTPKILLHRIYLESCLFSGSQ